jgi:hypothetical protein
MILTTLRQRLPAALLLSFALIGARLPETKPETGYDLIRAAVSGLPDQRREAARKIGASGDRSLVPGLVDALFFVQGDQREPLVAALRQLTGEDPGTRYHDWVEMVGRSADLVPAPGYLAWKGELFGRIDPHYRDLFAPGTPLRIRPEEILWGGVKLDGIPSLDDPPRVEATATRELEERERIFGVSLGGEHRAYPLRYLSWHEMLNDVVGGEPVTVSYCTLCGSGLAFSAKAPDGGRRTFGTSGLLYRSNKLMLDRETKTLWSQMTGEAVLGPLAAKPERLAILPMTLTTWGEWRTLHPDTTVLQLDARYGARWNYRYTPGAANLAREGVTFPLWKKSRLLPDGEEVFGLALQDTAKAWPVTKLLAQRVVSDRVGEVDVVLIGAPDSGSVRAYRRDGHTFRPNAEAAETELLPDALIDEAGRSWRLTEESLVPPPAAEGAAPLPRLPGHVALWFAWFGFHPQTDVWAR